MNRKQAIKILDKCAREYIKKRLAFEANLYEKGLATNDRCKKSYDEKKEILEAIAFFNEPVLW